MIYIEYEYIIPRLHETIQMAGIFYSEKHWDNFVINETGMKEVKLHRKKATILKRDVLPMTWTTK